MGVYLSEQERNYINQKYHLDYENKRNHLLDSTMLYLRKQRKHLPQSLTHMWFQRDDYVQLWFQTDACRFCQLGKCTICNYWQGSHHDHLLEQLLPTLTIPDNCGTLLINTCGSCLDPAELSEGELKLLLEWLRQSNIPSVIFETHWSTLSEKILSMIQSSLSHKRVFYEIGIESTSPDVLYYCLNKPSSLVDISPIIERIHRYDGLCIANIILGAPFLNAEEQMQDAKDSLLHLLKLEMDYLVLFPINIKPQTLPKLLNQNGYYRPVPAKLLAEVLRELPVETLSQINVAWFGDHREPNVIPPPCCPRCGERVFKCYCSFNASDNADVRRDLLDQISGISCGCIPSFFAEQPQNGTLCERLDFFYSWLECRTGS